MRVQTNNGITLRYPDEIGFAFNPCLLVAEGEMARMAITATCGDSQENIYLDAFDGKCYGDVREYVQTFFDTMQFGIVDYTEAQRTEMGKLISFVVAVVSADGTQAATFTFDVFYIWGALKAGGQESYNSYRVLKWFRGYPFTFGVYAAGGGSIMFARDGVPEKFRNIPEQGVWNVPLLDGEKAKRFYLISDCTGAFVEVTFDSTFDMTFRYAGGGVKTEKIRIDVLDGFDEGYYLRWIDRHGFYNYYLFKAGDESRKTSSDSLFYRNNLLAYDMSYGYEGYTGRQQQMSREDTIPVCAPLVDSATWDMLFDLATSPCVDLFAGYENGVPKWLSVTVAAASYTKTTAALQDFVCNIVMPDIPVQKL